MRLGRLVTLAELSAIRNNVAGGNWLAALSFDRRPAGAGWDVGWKLRLSRQDSTRGTALGGSGIVAAGVPVLVRLTVGQGDAAEDLLMGDQGAAGQLGVLVGSGAVISLPAAEHLRVYLAVQKDPIATIPEGPAVFVSIAPGRVERAEHPQPEGAIGDPLGAGGSVSLNPLDFAYATALRLWTVGAGATIQSGTAGPIVLPVGEVVVPFVSQTVLAVGAGTTVRYSVLSQE